LTPDSPLNAQHAPATSPKLEMAYVLFMDIVSYSLLPMDEQQRILVELEDTVRSSTEVTCAHAEDRLIALPTGDGMALVFFSCPESPVTCALQLARALRHHPEIKLRMGIHAGPVYRINDINEARNVAGGGINMAQRVMDCGDAGHILISKAAADVLVQLSTWKNVTLQDLGVAEVKHGVRIHIYNLHTIEAGNPEAPHKLHAARDVAAAAADATPKARYRWPQARLALIGMAMLLLAAGGAGLYWRSAHTPPTLTDKDTIILADFDNKTGDPVFDDTLKQGLAIQLEQSPFLELISQDKVSGALKLMKRPADSVLSPEVAREVCQRTNSKAMLIGSIASMGTQYIIGLKAVNCATGEVLTEAQEQAASKESVLKALDALAVSLRGKLGESLASVQRYDTPLEEVTTPSLEALQAFSQARRLAASNGDPAALPLYKRAVELDPKFALAYVGVAFSYFNLNELRQAAENARKAYALREKVSDRERLAIEGSYYMFTTGELEKAAQVYELRQQSYPRDVVAPTNLVYISFSLGNWEKALQEARLAIRLNPTYTMDYANLSTVYTSLNRLDEAKLVFKEAEERKLANELLLTSRYQLAFLKGDTAQMAEVAAAAIGKPGAEDSLFAAQADTEGWKGKLKNARELTRRAMESAQHNDARETAALYQAAAALREVESGNRKQASADAEAALKLAPNRDVETMAALALARAGDTARAQNVAAELDRSFPLDTLVQTYWLPTIRAALALERTDPAAAVELLKAASMIELSEPTQVSISLCPVYLRGEAYLMLHDGNAAAGEFQKFIDHYGLVANFPWGALARLGLARAYALSGDTAKAKHAYLDFLTFWKDADPDVPIYKQAQAEYTILADRSQ